MTGGAGDSVLPGLIEKLQQVFVTTLNNYIYAASFLIDGNSNIILQTAYPS